MVSNLSIAFMAVSLLVSVLLPVALTIYFTKNTRFLSAQYS